jgi:hypothetical protein
VGIISAGEDNPYGHPSPELLSRFGTAGVRMLRTDRDDAVHVLTDGTAIEIICFVACPLPLADPLRQARAPNRQQHAEQQ